LFDIESRGSVLFLHWFDDAPMYSGTPEVTYLTWLFRGV